jgi:rubredoxin
MEKYQCTICGYTYDPVKGDPERGVSEGMDFNDIPDSWTCPTCGAPKSEFEEL